MSELEHTPFKTCKELYYEALSELLYPVPSVKLHCFPELMKATNGLRAREFTILCGATGIGKTTLLANFSAELIRQNIPHFVASVETGHLDFMRRVLCVFERKDLNTGDSISTEEAKALHARRGELMQNESLLLSLYDNRVKVEQLMADIEHAVTHKKIKIAMIDNLNFFMEVTTAANAIVEMDRVVHELIIFCKNIDVHLIMVMHPRKMDDGRVESEFDIKGSSTAVQESHNIFLFNRIHKELLPLIKDAKESDREIKIAKMRRLGKHVGKRLVIGSEQGVYYFEKGSLCKLNIQR